jgi:hypothetical protein
MLLAALLPLAAVVGVNAYFTRQALIKQSESVLPSDANVTASRINDYMRERLLDGVALSSLDTAPKFLNCIINLAQVTAVNQQYGYQYMQPTPDCAANTVSYTESVGRAAAVGVERDSNYSLWNVYLFTSPTSATELISSQMKKLPDGSLVPAAQTPAPAAEIANVIKGQQAISPVYYDQTDNYAYVRIYTPIFKQFPPTAKSGAPLGFLQATLKLNAVWGFVDQGAKSSGSDSGAFILDQNGVRVADTDSTSIFTAVAPLSSDAQSQVSSLGLYGMKTAPTVQSLPQVASAAANSGQQTTFQSATVPGGKTTSQFASVKTRALDQDAPLLGAAGNNILPWTYFLDTPVASVTAVATQQLQLSLITAAIVAVLAMLLGLFIGSRTASPVEQSAQQLEGAAGMLKALASRQEGSASEQSWVVDACKTGIDGVKYLADAMNQAARRIVTAANWFNDYWDRLTEEQARATVQHLRELAAYIDEAARRQQASSERLDKAIAVTMQVSNQLLTGATEANQSADQLDAVVRDLQRVIGGKVSAIAESREEAETMRRRVESATSSMPAIGAPAPIAPPALPAPAGARPMSAAAAGRIAARAPRFPMNPPSQLGGDDWGAYSQYGNAAPPSQYGGYAPPSQYGNAAPPSQYGGSNFGQSGINGGMNGGYGGRNSGGASRSANGQNGQYGQNGDYNPYGPGPNSGDYNSGW